MSRRWTSKLASAVAVLTLALPAALLSAGSAAATTTPAAPVNVEPTMVGWEHVIVEWEHGSNETPWRYRVDNLTTGDVWMTSGTWPQVRVRGFEPEQTYELQVKAVDVYYSSEPVKVTVTTAAMPHVEPPGDVEVTNVAWNGADLSWEASLDEDLWSYEIIDLDRDRFFKIVGSDTLTTHLDLRPERTYRLGLRAARNQVDQQRVHSELRELTITTPKQLIEPPTGLQADRDGRNVTLTWQRPDDLEFPDAALNYLVYDGDVLETILDDPDTLTQTIPRVSSGEHEFTVRARYQDREHGLAISPPSNPVTVNVPSSDDTTPPQPPERVFVAYRCDGTLEYEIQGASDDTSSPEQIHYEAIRLDVRQPGNPFYVPSDGYALPGTGVLPHPHINRYSDRFRAVDEAGNRSEVVETVLRLEPVC